MHKIREFQRLLIAAQDMEMVKFAAIIAEQKLLASRIERYRVSKMQVRKDAATIIDLSSILAQRVSDKWSSWIDLEIRNQIDEMTKLAVVLEEQKKQSQIAFGRVSAFKKLAKKKNEKRRPTP